jgi:hypothetical protein
LKEAGILSQVDQDVRDTQQSLAEAEKQLGTKLD